MNNATTLVDKQGVFQRVPHNLMESREAKVKFTSCCALFELLSVINITLSDKHLWDNKIFVESVQKLLKHPALITKSVTAQKKRSLSYQKSSTSTITYNILISH